MRRCLAVLALVTMVLTGLVATTSPAQAFGKVKCGDPVAVARLDMIVHHDQTRAEAEPVTHLHQIYGTSAWTQLPEPNFANYSDMLNGSTTCRVSFDTAGYWVACVVKIAQPDVCLTTHQFTAYYRPFSGVGGPQFGPAQAFPPDTRLVGMRYNWTCGQNSGPVLSQPQDHIPNCSSLGPVPHPGKTLSLHIDFPSCMQPGFVPNHPADEVGNTNDNAHFAYVVKKGKAYTCPPGFETPVTQLREDVQIDYTGDGSDVMLSSDPEHGTTGGRSAHGDFENSWQQDKFVQWVKDCVNVGGNYSAKVCQP